MAWEDGISHCCMSRLCQRLLISGGIGGVGRYDDMWLMDLQSRRMEDVRTALEDLSYSCYK